MIGERLQQQIDFIIEIDKLKQVYRQTLIMDGSRRENDSEHSWHLAIMAFVLQEYAQGELDLAKVLKMVLLHDVVEIDAGDTFCYDEQAGLDKEEREMRAAERIFAILPADQRDEYHALWEEFEAGQTPEAKFAVALDRIQPMLHNYHTNGGTWMKYGVGSDQVRKRMEPVAQGAPQLGDYLEALITDAIKQGFLDSDKVEGRRS